MRTAIPRPACTVGAPASREGREGLEIARRTPIPTLAGLLAGSCGMTGWAGRPSAGSCGMTGWAGRPLAGRQSRFAPFERTTSAYQRALAFGVRRCVAKSTCTMPKRLS